MREQLQILLAVMVVLIVGGVAYKQLFLTEEEVTLIVRETGGQVTRLADGEMTAALPGMVLSESDTLSVAADSKAELSVGGETTLTLESSSAIRVVGVDRSGVRVELEEGRVSAEVRPDSPALSVSSRGRAVSATDASFNIAAQGDGALSVETTRGEVSLEGFEGHEVLRANERLTDMPNEEPVVGKIPEEMLLSITRWPPEMVRPEDELFIEGRTAPYAEVTLVIGEAELFSTRASADGRFRAPLARNNLREGENLMTVRATDVMGQQQQEPGTVTLDRSGPLISTDVDLRQ